MHRPAGWALLFCWVVAAPQAEDWGSLAARCAEGLRVVRAARIAQDPAEILAAELAYAARMEQASEFARDHAPVGSAAENVWCHLLADRRAAASERLLAQWPAWQAGFDSLGVARFFVGLAAYESDRFALAAEIFASPGPPYLRAHSEFLHLRALEEAGDPRAGGVAWALARSGPQHPFHDAAALRAARHLLNEGEVAELKGLLTPWLTRLPAKSALAAAAHTLLAEGAAQKGKRREQLSAFRAAQGWRGMPEEETQLRVEQARRILRSGRHLHLTPEDANACCAILIRNGTPREAREVWERHRHRLPAAARPARALELLERFYELRDHTALREISRALRGTVYAPRMWLILGRAARREGDLVRLASAYGAAAVGENAAVAEQALWEWGRELEDARIWPLAAECFARLVAEHPGGDHAAEAQLRGALCRYRAGDVLGALVKLEEQCKRAPERKRGGPCLWRGLWGTPEERETFLLLAGTEVRPGYHALRAAMGGQGTSEEFWRDLTLQVGGGDGWTFPATREHVDQKSTARILALCEENPLAEAGWLFMAYGYLSWARGLWEHLPGRHARATDERAALSRALGDFPRAILHGAQTDSLFARYPIAFSPQIAAAARENGLSPAFLLAVMRQESLLSPVAHSRAGAVGLMQLMPGTAQRLADSLGLATYELECPADNVRLGAAHLTELWRTYNGHVPMVLAAYNAGRSHAERWLAGSPREAANWDDYVEQISYAETRKFVKSVLMHYWSILAAYRNP